MLPLVAPILAVTSLLGFIGTINEVLFASIFLHHAGHQDPRRRPVRSAAGPAQRQLRHVRRRIADHRDPDRGAVPVPAALHRVRSDRGSGQGMSTYPAVAHHDGSALYVPTQAPTLGDTLFRSSSAVRSAAVWSGSTSAPHRTVNRTSPRPWSTASRTARSGGGPSCAVRNPVTNYRFLLVGASGYRWLTGYGVVRPRRPGRHRLPAGGLPGRAGVGHRRHRLPDLPGPVRALRRGGIRVRLRTGRSRATGTRR